MVVDGLVYQPGAAPRRIDRGIRVANSNLRQLVAARSAPGAVAAPAAGAHSSQRRPTASSQRSHAAPTAARRAQPVPEYVCVDADKSSVEGVAGAVAKQLHPSQPWGSTCRLVALSTAAIPRAVAALSAANSMTKACSACMLVFQPRLVSARLARPPRLPPGAWVLTVAAILEGDVQADSLLVATARTEPPRLARAIFACVMQTGHVQLECMGGAALAPAVQAVGLARGMLLRELRDVACVLASSQLPEHRRGGDGRRGTAYRLVLLECDAWQPWKLHAHVTFK